MNNRKEFFRFVIPSVIAFALSGIYAIVDGFFVGNTIGDAGLSAINMAYPIVAFIQAVGTGIGMGGAVYYSINKAENNEKRAGEFAAASWWLLVIASLLLTAINYFFAKSILSLLGMQGEILSYGVEYIKIIALGATLQVLGTGMVPLMRNYGGSFMAMVAMVGGFVTNIIFDYIFVWVEGCGMGGAALATVIGQGVTALTAIIYSVYKKRFFVKASLNRAASTVGSIFKVGLAPFGLALTPNISLVIINIFSVQYGGDKAVATYACIGYIICIIYLVLQGVGDGCQPLMSQYYGEKREADLKEIKKDGVYICCFSCGAGMCDDVFGTMEDRSAVRLIARGEYQYRRGHSYFSHSGSVCGCHKSFYGELLCDGEKHLLIYPYIYRTRINAGFYADPSADFWRTDYDMVEHGNCKNSVSSFGAVFDKKGEMASVKKRRLITAAVFIICFEIFNL